MGSAGRPSKFSEEVADAICDMLGDGQSIVAICRAEDMPSRRTVQKWIADNEEFRTRCVRAKELAAEAEAERLIELADDLEIPPEHKKYMISTRQWIASKLLPKKYGDRVQTDVAVDLSQQSVETLVSALAALEADNAKRT